MRAGTPTFFLSKSDLFLHTYRASVRNKASDEVENFTIGYTSRWKCIRAVYDLAGNIQPDDNVETTVIFDQSHMISLTTIIVT